EGSRDWHLVRGHGAHLRSVLHDAPGGHRPRSADLEEHHRRHGRNARRRQRAGRRHGDPHRSSDHTSARAERSRGGTGMSAIHGSILLADDEEKILKRLGRALRDEGHEVVETTSARGAQKQLLEKSFDLLVVDNIMPGMTGLELIRELSQTVPPSERPQVLMMTAHATVESAIEAMKLGALD